jgi:hypothetical protein
MDTNRDRRITLHALLAFLFGLSLLFMPACSAEPGPKSGMEITGVVTDYRNKMKSATLIQG